MLYVHLPALSKNRSIPYGGISTALYRLWTIAGEIPYAKIKLTGTEQVMERHV
ncbi:hypothetical protein MiSe_52950 [Microseira wollei NIES-4236]|uniref:Transposase n=2 Tax=Microseira wollei TaxID=467598 RepID=A0AAV3XGC1_9CYAN|nr:hypothetical protein MiSe_52950 [Microseira wollei NIES-4236]